MRKFIKILLLLLIPALALAQRSHLDSLKKALHAAPTDSVRYLCLNDLDNYYVEVNRDSALYYLNTKLLIAQKNGRTLDEANALDSKGYILMHLGKYPESLECLQQALILAENPKNENSWARIKDYTQHRMRISVLASIHHDMGHLMGNTNNIDQQIVQYGETRKLATEAGVQELLGLVNMNLGHVYLDLNRLDTALLMEQNAEKNFKQTAYKKYLGYVYLALGSIYLQKGDKYLKLKYDHNALNSAIEQKNFQIESLVYKDLAGYYLSQKQPDSSLFYARKALGTLNTMGSTELDQAYENLYNSYKLAGKPDSAYKYQGLALTAKDSSFKATEKSLADFQKLSFKAQVHAQDLEKEKAAIQTRIRMYVLLGAIAVFMLIAGIFYRNNRQKQKVNNLLFHQNEEIVQQKEEIESQRDNLEQTLTDLKATQTQLIQSEKMASLGELTAGIAHEIQNPLNFVNNFSEVNKEMLEELKAESKKQKAERDEVLEIELINNLIENEQKISHHGKRADSIVKGMLEHSRNASGQKEPTDINQLADEYLRLSYHGLRAKDKNFNAELVTHFDPKLPKVNATAQDIGRVLLNLFNNAFYAVNQKKRGLNGDYKPEVSVTTSVENGRVIIKVKDNGIGIPDVMKEKIMQPFFTTKPTGEGTGLGLSLSYDMVVKGHGGKIDINTKEGEFTEFTVTLPLN
jgi:two-component system, NtrC family, sensor kinase